MVKGIPGVTVGPAGAEYGMLSWTDADRDCELGGRGGSIPTNLDLTVNAYDRMYVCRNERLVDVYPIMGRLGPPQR